MEAIRTKDKLFLAVVVPLALAAAYFHFWRTPTAQQLDSQTRECAALVTTEDFPFERAQAERRLKAEREAHEAEGKIPPPVTTVKANPADSAAAREREVLDIFHRAGLMVESVSSSREDTAHDIRLCELLKSTGTRPNPLCRTYAITGRYSAILDALRLFASREMAILPESVTMPTPNHWTLVLWM